MVQRYTSLKRALATQYSGQITREIDGTRTAPATDGNISFYDSSGAQASFPQTDKYNVWGVRHGEVGLLEDRHPVDPTSV